MDGPWQYLPTTFGMGTTLTFNSLSIKHMDFNIFFHLNTSISYSIAIKVFSLPKILNYDFTLFFVGGDFPSQMIWSVFEKMEAVTFPFGLTPEYVKEAESSSLAY
ncbi:hypothetical protein NC651_031438 [Populus alba x Populus x berolinensis]|nr:hypothetical protein NC651_031438 [Populus alba x Populus x berolinensis]